MTGVVSREVCGKKFADVFSKMAVDTFRRQKAIQTRQLLEETKLTQYVEKGTLYENITIYLFTLNGLDGDVIRIDDIIEKVKLE